MRWDNLRLDEADAVSDARVPLFARGAVARTFDTPGFRGMTFYEVQAKSIVSRVPESSRVPFRWTINPYRGCQHSCIYCYARNSHTYLDLDAGHDFDSKVIVKVNAPELLRARLASPSWAGEHIAMGSNVDCYQRAEGRYQLMRGIIAALRDAANPFSILTKGTLILRDVDLLLEAAGVTQVGLNVSAGFVDRDLWRAIEPGTPAPERRLEACAALNDSGLGCGVLMGPVVPYLSDSPAQLAAAVRQVAAAGASHVTPIVLHLRPGTREWFMGWLRTAHPELLPRYAELYGRGAYAPRAYQDRIAGQVRELAGQHGIGRVGAGRDPASRAAADPARNPRVIAPLPQADSPRPPATRAPAAAWHEQLKLLLPLGIVPPIRGSHPRTAADVTRVTEETQARHGRRQPSAATGSPPARHVRSFSISLIYERKRHHAHATRRDRFTQGARQEMVTAEYRKTCGVPRYR